MDRYSFIVSDLHRLLVAGLPAQKDSVRHPQDFSVKSQDFKEIIYLSAAVMCYQS
jgi:hypothetical protein